MIDRLRRSVGETHGASVAELGHRRYPPGGVSLAEASSHVGTGGQGRLYWPDPGIRSPVRRTGAAGYDHNPILDNDFRVGDFVSLVHILLTAQNRIRSGMNLALRDPVAPGVRCW
ncbi:hypothetical protein J6TS7_65000 [Paenibacillus dendritiformis]|nr:hypothetical protein J6TS7_65000 [Paenibacillus dendritiformis]